MIPDKSKIEEIIRELHRIMRIQDWDINFKFVSEAEARDIYGEDCSGGNLRKRHSQESHIIINQDNNQIKNVPDYWYHTLIHELYHIVTDAFIYVVDDSRQFILDEKARKEWKESTNVKYEELVDKLAKGFVNAYPATNFNHILKG